MKNSMRGNFVRHITILGAVSLAVLAVSIAGVVPEITIEAATTTKDQKPDASTRARVAQEFGKLPMRFEANTGQSDRNVKFLSRGSGYTLFLTSNEAVLSLKSQERRDVLRMQLKGSN